ncbi:MAG: hypothetical protein CMQ45_10825 [Gammaproteobacteria bacterium]|nr:hypothetical protein [Gammaproteobacteria bacterium]
MEISAEQILQRAVDEHSEGNLQDAERLYREILQSQPTHPDANYNLGVLAVSLNKTDEALPLFKTALEANPKMDQFWISYIDALIKEQQFGTAERMIEQAKQQGVNKGRLSPLEANLSPTAKRFSSVSINPPQELLTDLSEFFQNGQFSEAEKLAIKIIQDFPEHQIAWKALGAILGETGRKSEAMKANQTAVTLSPQDAEAHNNLGITLKGLGRLDEALASYKRAITLKPDFTQAHSNLGNTLKELRRLDEALASYKQAIALKPNYAEAHNNLGITLQELGRSDEALASYSQAIALKPNYAEAHNNLGITLKELGRLEEALVSYKQALALKADFPEAHNNLGLALQELGRFDEALAVYNQAIALKPDYAEAYVNLGFAIKNVAFNSPNPQLYPQLTQLLSAGNFTRAEDVAKSILSLLKQDAKIKDLLRMKTSAVSLNEVASVIMSLDKFSLLHHLMRVCPLPDLQFEKFFVAIRSSLLRNKDKIESSPEFIHFLSTLSIHCFTNEYIFIESQEETHLVDDLQTKISQVVARSEQPKVIDILCFASYRPLNRYDWCQKLESLKNLEEVAKRMIREPLLEKVIAKDIPVLQEISNDVSLKVKKQYEENPYPRWVKIGIPMKKRSIAAIFDELMLKLDYKGIKSVESPSILIAGCGTGQHSIETASLFLNCRVTAVDLSLASLAYALRKSNELGITNIDYLQADILHLSQMSRKFEIIESGGVLHHMEEPMTGWRVLVDILKPGGVMKVGLYSELARQDILRVRKEIAALSLGTSEAAIRKFRKSISESHDVSHQRLMTSSDFFSLSSLRDLIFHIQEHHFTVPKIKTCLDELGLEFCGFENKGVISNFREHHGNGADIYDLDLWHQYEERNPQAFVGMYQFWCQKTRT